MGFLRKVGRKIKKKVNKLFGGKFGKILGGVGLSMMFFGGAQALFGKSPWWEGFSERLKNTKLFGKNNAVDAIETVAEVGGQDSLGKGTGLFPGEAEVITGETVSKGASAVLNEKSKGNILSSLKESEFIPNVAEGLTTSLAISAVQGEPEEPFISGGVASQPQMEASQNAYLTEVQNQIPQYQGTNFQGLMNSMIYGTLSPDYLRQQAQEQGMLFSTKLPDPINI
tara:strand:+ start:300 stop:977 length:678 start_codon:yes stop_codon:yes gene_type:complete